MTDEEIKATEAYKMGMKATNAIWKQDADALRSDAQVFLKTHEFYSACWKKYKESIPRLTEPDFWKYPMGEVVSAIGGRHPPNSEAVSIDWILDIDVPFGEATPSYGTIMKLLLTYTHILEKLWKEKYCKIVCQKVS